jgi:hypothetical protein
VDPPGQGLALGAGQVEVVEGEDGDGQAPVAQHPGDHGGEGGLAAGLGSADPHREARRRMLARLGGKAPGQGRADRPGGLGEAGGQRFGGDETGQPVFHVATSPEAGLKASLGPPRRTGRAVDPF